MRDAANTPEREAPCGCKWYADDTAYKCLTHAGNSDAAWRQR